MSLHNKPLTKLEKEGLIEHRLPISEPSQLSDTFRLGVAWALKSREVVKCEHEFNSLDYCIKCGIDAFTT